MRVVAGVDCHKSSHKAVFLDAVGQAVDRIACPTTEDGYDRAFAAATITIQILKTNGHSAPGKLADAEIHFTGGELDGLKLVGFAVWKSRHGHGEDITFPSRHFTVQGERRSFALLRWSSERTAQERVAALVRRAYAEQAFQAATV